MKIDKENELIKRLSKDLDEEASEDSVHQSRQEKKKKELGEYFKTKEGDEF